MKFFAATLSNDAKVFSDIFFKDMNFNSAELYGEWRAEKENKELVDIREITEDEMKEKSPLYRKMLCC